MCEFCRFIILCAVRVDVINSFLLRAAIIIYILMVALCSLLFVVQTKHHYNNTLVQQLIEIMSTACQNGAYLISLDMFMIRMLYMTNF